MTLQNIQRCRWVNLRNPLCVQYHDLEWGVPLYDDQKLFELLCLEGQQAGLSWETILNRREEYRKAFWSFDPKVISTKNEEEMREQMQNFKVIKNKMKVLAVHKNASAYFKILSEHRSFSDFLWSFVQHKSIHNTWKLYSDAPTQTTESILMSKALKKYGFSFVGPVICYAFMQATGMVRDHEEDCWREKSI